MEVTNLFTVVIAEKYFTDGIEKYRQFLDPFIKTNNVAFCEWNKSGESLQEMIPELMNSIIRHKQWRAIILCGDDGADRKNPFDLSGYVPVDKKNYDTEEAYLLETRDAMYDALDRASKLPSQDLSHGCAIRRSIHLKMLQMKKIPNTIRAVSIRI